MPCVLTGHPCDDEVLTLKELCKCSRDFCNVTKLSLPKLAPLVSVIEVQEQLCYFKSTVVPCQTRKECNFFPKNHFSKHFSAPKSSSASCSVCELNIEKGQKSSELEASKDNFPFKLHLHAKKCSFNNLSFRRDVWDRKWKKWTTSDHKIFFRDSGCASSLKSTFECKI